MFILDEFDEEMTLAQQDGGELSGVQNVLDAEQIAKLLNKGQVAALRLI